MEDEKPIINVLVDDEFTRQAKNSYSLSEPLILSFSGTDRNLHDDLPKIQAVVGSIGPLALDLYRIALVVFVWDIRSERSIVPRQLHALVSVSNKDKWDSVRSHLEATLRFLTGDTFTFHFVQGNRPQQTLSSEFTQSGDCVVLFSGGLDSLAGVKWAIDSRFTPVLISHPQANLIDSTQEQIVSRLNSTLTSPLQWHQIRATPERGKKLRGETSTQFSRSFLYLSIATIFALGLGIEKIFICENGVIALNIPLTQGRVYDSTKTVHPRFLAKYQELLNMVFRGNLTVTNPFIDRTKGEVVKLLNTDVFRELVPLTISCSELQRLWRTGVKTSKVRHCGICLPCVTRRIATHHAGIVDDARYSNDIEGGYARIPDEGKKLLFELADFARAMDRLSNADEAFSEFPEFWVEGYDPSVLFEMCRRQVAQFEAYAKEKLHETLRSKLGIANV